MKPRLGQAFLSTALTVILAVMTAGLASAAQGSFDRNLQVSGPVDLEVSTGSGAIHVRAGTSGTVEVHGAIKANNHLGGLSAEEKVRQLEAHPPIEQDGNTIRIGHISEPNLRQNVSISYELVVPAETRLRAETGSGDQSVEGIQGPLKASTGSGGLRLTRIGSEVHAETGSGDIQIDSVQGSVTASTGSGSIRASGVAGDFSGETGSGDVAATAVPPRLRTGIRTGQRASSFLIVSATRR